MVTKALVLLAAAVSALWLVGPVHPAPLHLGPVEASSHTAVRSFSASPALPGGRLEVTITPTDYGSIGQVLETLPSGFNYTGSSLAAAQVAAEGQTVTFTLLGESSFRYTVTAPSAEGSYDFSGAIKDVNREAASVSGASTIQVGPPPTPAPTTAATATPEPTATPQPTATPAPPATATAAPTPTPMPTPAPPLPEPVEEGTPGWLILVVVAGVVLLITGVVAFVLRRRR